MSFAALPDIAKGLLNTSVGTVKATFNAVVEITTQTADALFGGDFETAWNTVVDGLFGPIGNDGFVTSSVPGVLESLTIGPALVRWVSATATKSRASGCGASSRS